MPAPLTVVGIGASAGGLAALEAFFGQAERLSNVAFVVFQHMGANTPSLLPELLQRVTGLPVLAIEKGARLVSGTVYVTPPGVDIDFVNGRFRLAAQQAAARARLPIDTFFRSLAAAYQQDAVGVVLSGMGSDGTLGLGALKEQGGAAFVQSPGTAQFDSMPRSALNAGAADLSAAPAELPGLIADYLAHARPQGAAVPSEAQDLKAMDDIVATLRAQTGHDFSAYKKSTLHRRIERRMALHHRRSLADYSRAVRQNKAEAELLFKELLIGVTSFFRDPRVWEHLRQVALPELLATRGTADPLRIWTPGCSTGEEAYTLAMVLAEAIDDTAGSTHGKFRIFATDIDGDAIDRARLARYPLSIASTVSAERLARFFVQEETGYRVRKELRESVVFALQNIAMDPPFTKLDLLVCRNLLIYFEPTLQRRLLPLFHYSLKPGGLLMLGTAETTGSSLDHFEPLPGKFKLYRRLETFRSSGFVAFPATFDRHAVATPPLPRAGEGDRVDDLSQQHLADHLLLQRYSPAAVLVNRHGDVLYVSGRTGRYLEAAAGKANWNVFAMAREGLNRPLSAAFMEAVRDQRGVTTDGSIFDPDLGTRALRVTVDPITSPAPLAGLLMIVFNDMQVEAAAKPTKGGVRPAGASRDRELARLRESLRAALEEVQTAEEQSRASNEELQSTNEELQSTNEELTTSKEELQSMNEELQTVNQELQSKVEELSQASDDMRNLLNSTEIATLFLDERLHIRRYTSQAVTVFKLIPTDVGRPITDITNALENWRVADDAEEVLRTLVPKEKEVSASGGRWFKVRMMPYRTSDNRIDGVVITLSDVSMAKHLESRLTKALAASGQRLPIAPVKKAAAKRATKTPPAAPEKTTRKR